MTAGKSPTQTADPRGPGYTPPTRPTQDPADIYPKVPGIDTRHIELPGAGLGEVDRRRALSEFQTHEALQKANFLGYQANQALHFRGDYAQYLDDHINNIGDPFSESHFTVNSKMMERAVLDYYASLWRAKWPHDPADPEAYWGYVVSMGCSEGNLYGLWNARDYLSGKFLMDDAAAPTAPTATAATATGNDGRPRRVHRRLVYHQASAPGDLPNAYRPVAFYSDDTHYSIVKMVQVLAIQTFYEVGTALYPHDNPLAPGAAWPSEVPSNGGAEGPGSIDIAALATLVEFFASKGHPILVCFNYGTTFKGAYDDVAAAGAALMPILSRYGLDERKVHYDPANPDQYDVRTGYWFHVDGALGAGYMPFIEMAHAEGRLDRQGPIFDFRLPFVQSIAMSGHKWIGAPWPCGIYMTRVKYQIRPPDDPAYIVGSPDTTFAGSRNGFSAMILWDYLARHSYAAQVARALETEAMAAYIEARLRDLERQLGTDLWIARTDLSLTVRFKAASADLIYKYSLSGEELSVNGQARQYSHVYAMPHVTRETVDALIADLAQPGAFPDQDVAPTTSPSKRPPTDARPLVHVPTSGRGFR